MTNADKIIEYERMKAVSRERELELILPWVFGIIAMGLITMMILASMGVLH